MSDSDDTKIDSISEKEPIRRMRRKTSPPFSSRRPSWLKNRPDPHASFSSTSALATSPRPARYPGGIESHRTWKIWTTYAKEASEYDQRITGDWNESMDVLLIFAGLFSSVLTTFIQVSWPWLSADNPQLTAKILYAASHGQPIPASLDPSADFAPPGWAVRVNVAWVVSLVMSLAVATFAMLSKSWIREYMRVLPAAPYDQAHHRQFRLEGIRSWSMANIMEILPLMLHLSVVLFCWGLVEMSAHANSTTVFLVTTGTCTLTLALYALFCILPMFDPRCPFKTPWAALFGVTARQSLAASVARMQKGASTRGYTALGADDATNKELAEARALLWLFEETLDHDMAVAAISAALNLESSAAQSKVLLSPGVLPVLCRMFLDCEGEQRAAKILRGIDLVYQSLPEVRIMSNFNPDDELLDEFHTKLANVMQTSSSDELLCAAIQFANVLRQRNALFLPIAYRFSTARLIRQIGTARFADNTSLAAALQVTAHMLSLPGSVGDREWNVIEAGNLRSLLTVVTAVLKTSTSTLVLESALDLVRSSTDAAKLTPAGWVQLNQDLYLDASIGLLSGLVPLLAGSSTDSRLRRKVREILCALMLLSELGDGQGVQAWIVAQGHVPSVVGDFDQFHVARETRDDCSAVHLLVQVLGRGRLRDNLDAFVQAGTLDALKAHFARARHDRPPILLGDAADLLRALLGLVGTVSEDVLRESAVLQSVVGDLRDVNGGSGEEIRELEGLMDEAREYCGQSVLFIR